MFVAQGRKRLCGGVFQSNTCLRSISTGRYAANVQPFQNLIGPGIVDFSVLSAALRGEPTQAARGTLARRCGGGGQARSWRSGDECWTRGWLYRWGKALPSERSARTLRFAPSGLRMAWRMPARNVGRGKCSGARDVAIDMDAR